MKFADVFCLFGTLQTCRRSLKRINVQFWGWIRDAAPCTGSHQNKERRQCFVSQGMECKAGLGTHREVVRASQTFCGLCSSLRCFTPPVFCDFSPASDWGMRRPVSMD
ncbi:hypothetical protein BR93DRAFT_247803 [Coniochaeta sp. PMI_546]|nr:hypothetical protein BR93DRAFT_247803 [Coniochaeta sp. PMI_546]